MTSAAIAFGFVFDHPLSSDLRPLEALLGLPLGTETLADILECQVLMPRATRKITRPLRFNWKRLSAAISSGDTIVFDLRRELPRPMPGRLELHAECLAPDQLEEARLRGEWPHAGLPYRYQGQLGLGTDFLKEPQEVETLVEQVMERWSSQIELRAGVAVADASLEDAEAYARGSGGMPGTELDRRTTNLWVASKTWGRKAREPEWGTYLTRAHADVIGGVDGIHAAVKPYRILEASGIIFVQLTPYAQALSPETDEKRRTFLQLMDPIVARPLSRD